MRDMLAFLLLEGFLLSFFIRRGACAARCCWFSYRTSSLCLCRRLLLLRDRSLTRPFAGTRIRMRALPANRQVPTMAESAIGADFDEPLDVHRNFLAQITFHQSLGLNDRADAVDLFFAEVRHLLHRVDLRLVENASRARMNDP